MYSISTKRRGGRDKSLVVLLLAALAATLALATPSKARADATWGASVAFYCYDHPAGGEFRVAFSGFGEYRFAISVNGGAWSVWTAWGSQVRWLQTGNANVRFAAQYRRWLGSYYQYSAAEWGAVYQVVGGYNQWRGWGAICVL
jgi:hypothetical protein